MRLRHSASRSGLAGRDWLAGYWYLTVPLALLFGYLILKGLKDPA